MPAVCLLAPADTMSDAFATCATASACVCSTVFDRTVTERPTARQNAKQSNPTNLATNETNLAARKLRNLIRCCEQLSNITREKRMRGGRKNANSLEKLEGGRTNRKKTTETLGRLKRMDCLQLSHCVVFSRLKCGWLLGRLIELQCAQICRNMADDMGFFFSQSAHTDKIAINGSFLFFKR